MWSDWRLPGDAPLARTSSRKRYNSQRGRVKKCPGDCPCLCHEGCGDVEHLGRRCYGKTGDVSDWDQDGR